MNFGSATGNYHARLPTVGRFDSPAFTNKKSIHKMNGFFMVAPRGIEPRLPG